MKAFDNTSMTYNDLTLFYEELRDYCVPKYFTKVEYHQGSATSDDPLYIDLFVSDTAKVRLLVTGPRGANQHIQIWQGEEISLEFLVENFSSISYTFTIGARAWLTDNCFAFGVRNSGSSNSDYTNILMFTKDKNDRTCIFTTLSHYNPSYSSLQLYGLNISAAATWYVLCYVIEEAYNRQEIASQYSPTVNTSDGYIAMEGVSCLQGGGLKGVYLANYRPFSNNAEPFLYTINGESYCGFGYNTIIVKTT